MSSPRRGTPAQLVFPGRAARGGQKSSEATDQSAAGVSAARGRNLGNLAPRHANLFVGRAVEKRSGLFKGVVPSLNVCETRKRKVSHLLGGFRE